MKWLATVALALTLAVPAQAQTPVPSPTPPTTQLAWDHDGVNVDGFKLYVDCEEGGASCGSEADLGAVSREADGSYRVAFPALTPGTHVIEVSAYNVAGESDRARLEVSVVVIPSDPMNLRIVVTEGESN